MESQARDQPQGADELSNEHNHEAQRSPMQRLESSSRHRTPNSGFQRQASGSEGRWGSQGRRADGVVDPSQIELDNVATPMADESEEQRVRTPLLLEERTDLAERFEIERNKQRDLTQEIEMARNRQEIGLEPLGIGVAEPAKETDEDGGARSNQERAEASQASEIPRTYHAPWPSLWMRLMSWLRPLVDLYVIAAMVVLYSTASVRAEDHVVWRFVKGNTWLFVWVPFAWRFCGGLLHWILSLVIMPGCLLYHEGPLLRLFPRALQDTVNENYVYRETYRKALMKCNGIDVQLWTPDGVKLDCLYFKGKNAAPNAATIVRFNGNAETFDLQDEIMPLMYTLRGFNFIMFNYRGVGRSQWPRVFGSEIVGLIYSIWSMPALIAAMIDAWTVLQFVYKELGVEANQIALVGHSIGGAIATKLAADNSHSPYVLCNSRSFAALSPVASRLAPSFLGLLEASTKGKAAQVLTQVLLWVSGWELNSVKNWKRVFGFKWIEFCAADPIIPVDLSLHAALSTSPLPPPGEMENMMCGVEEVGGSPCIRLECLYGVDNHNRRWLSEEAALHMTLVTEGLRKHPLRVKTGVTRVDASKRSVQGGTTTAV